MDYTASIAPNPRWPLERKFPELSANDAKGLHRATVDPGYNLLGLPYHRGLKSDRADLPGTSP